MVLRNANIITENSGHIVYDLSNQLIRVLQGSNQVAEYTYNGAGQRIKKVTQTQTRIFHYDRLGHLIAETNQSGQMLAEYVYLGDQLLAMIKPGESAYYFHNDHLGTPQVLTDDAQAIAWKAVYTPFGEAVPSIETVENPFRFPGQYYDQETGLHYNYFRYYDPTTGRYITPDPIGLEGGINLFAYVANDPINWIDPYGLLTKPVPGPIRPPDEGAPMGSYYGSRRAKTSPTGVVLYYYPHRGVDYLAPAGASVVAPISGTVEPWGTEGVRICRKIGTICCNGVEYPKMECWKLVHINPT